MLDASERPPVLFNVREAFKAKVPLLSWFSVCLSVGGLGTLGPKALKSGQFKAAKTSLPRALFVPISRLDGFQVCSVPCLSGSGCGSVLSVTLPHTLGRLGEARPL